MSEDEYRIDIVLNLKVVAGTRRSKITVSFDVDDDDPRAEAIFCGVGELLKKALTAEEARDMMRDFRTDIERAAGRKP